MWATHIPANVATPQPNANSPGRTTDSDFPGTNPVPRIVTFGEIMARMAPAGVLRLRQVLPGSLDVTFAGAEANVAASLALLGIEVDFVTSLPADSPLTESCLASLRSLGIGTQHISVSDRGRFGVYFVEMGANQRPSRVYYDREHSAISQVESSEFDWQKILDGADWLHLTGITPALSRQAAETTIAAAATANERGVKVSCDVNFRSKLWRWDAEKSPRELAGAVLNRLMPLISLLLANEDDAGLLGIVLPAQSGAAVSGAASRAAEVAAALYRRYPNLQYIATTLREQLSASHNNWSAMLFDTRQGTVTVAPFRNGVLRPYEIRNIVDRVGSGDAFDAGLLYGLIHPGFTLQRTLEFATAASCLAHSIVGDCNFASRSEIEDLIDGASSGRVVR